jgi:hypothetical protein
MGGKVAIGAEEAEIVSVLATTDNPDIIISELTLVVADDFAAEKAVARPLLVTGLTVALLILLSTGD